MKKAKNGNASDTINDEASTHEKDVIDLFDIYWVVCRIYNINTHKRKVSIS